MHVRMGSCAGLSHHPCRTWDRGDLLRRLHTFKSSTWFCKPAGATPVDCARKGWINVSLDMLSCEVSASPGAPDVHAKHEPRVIRSVST